MSEGVANPCRGRESKLIEDINERIFIYKRKEFSKFISNIMMMLLIFFPFSFYVDSVAPLATLASLAIQCIVYGINP